MSSKQPAQVGTIGWFDLTVNDAPRLRDFYAEVVGWQPSEVALGDYSDFSMVTPSGDAVAGICHARGENAAVPPQWIICLYVADLDRSVAACLERGGKIIMPIKSYGDPGRYSIIQDPAGAAVALFQKNS